MLHDDAGSYNDRTFRRALGSLNLLLRGRPFIAKRVGRDRGLCYHETPFVEGLALDLLRRSAHPLRVAEISPFRTAQTTTASSPSLARPATWNSPDPSSINRRPSLITNQGIDKCL